MRLPSLAQPDLKVKCSPFAFFPTSSGAWMLKHLIKLCHCVAIRDNRTGIWVTLSSMPCLVSASPSTLMRPTVNFCCHQNGLVEFCNVLERNRRWAYMLGWYVVNQHHKSFLYSIWKRTCELKSLWTWCLSPFDPSLSNIFQNETYYNGGL